MSDKKRAQTESNSEEDDIGFIILDGPSDHKPRTETPKEPKHKTSSDAMIAQNLRRVHERYIAQPVIKDGKHTGEWVVFQTGNWQRYQFKNDIPWDATLPSKDAVDEWAYRLLDRPENRG